MALKDKFGRDFSASLVVYLVALPLCMGIALASGAPPAKGLLTGIVGGLLVGLISGAPLQVSGPAAGLAVVVFEIIREHGLAALGPILLLAGLVQVLAGALKLGRWFRAISPAVVHGMLAGIGLLIVFQQFHVMLDNKPKGSGLANVKAIPSAIFGGIFPLDGSAEERAIVLALLTIGVMLLWQFFRPRRLKLVPGALLGIVVASGVAHTFHMDVNYVQVPSSLRDVLAMPKLADFSSLTMNAVGSALVLALIASAETLLSAAAVAKMRPDVKTNYDRELMAQGVGNSICGLLGAIPMTGVIVRSSANVQAGAQTRASAMLHGVWLLLTVLLFAGLLRSVPVSSLAGVLVLTGIQLVKIKDIKHLATFGRVPVAIYAVTMLTILATDLLTGVLTGVVLSTLALLYNATHLKIVSGAGPVPGEWTLAFEGSATFVRIPAISAALEAIPHDVTAVHVLTDNLRYVDHSCLDMLQDWAGIAEKSGVRVVLERSKLSSKYWEPTPA